MIYGHWTKVYNSHIFPAVRVVSGGRARDASVWVGAVTRRNSAMMTAEQVEAHNAKVRGRRIGPVGDPFNLKAAPMPAATAIKPRMNKTEAEWAMILEARKRAGEIVWYGFEAIKLRLADNTHYTPDFAVITAFGHNLELHETKGFWRDDARVKIKVAAEMFPFFKFFAMKKRRKKDGGGWAIEGF